MPRSLVHIIIISSVQNSAAGANIHNYQEGEGDKNAIYTEMNVLVKMALGISRNLTQGNNG